MTPRQNYLSPPPSPSHASTNRRDAKKLNRKNKNRNTSKETYRRTNTLSRKVQERIRNTEAAGFSKAAQASKTFETSEDTRDTEDTEDPEVVEAARILLRLRADVNGLPQHRLFSSSLSSITETGEALLHLCANDNDTQLLHPSRPPPISTTNAVESIEIAATPLSLNPTVDSPRLQELSSFWSISPQIAEAVEAAVALLCSPAHFNIPQSHHLFWPSPSSSSESNDETSDGDGYEPEWEHTTDSDTESELASNGDMANSELASDSDMLESVVASDSNVSEPAVASDNDLPESDVSGEDNVSEWEPDSATNSEPESEPSTESNEYESTAAGDSDEYVPGFTGDSD